MDDGLLIFVELLPAVLDEDAGVAICPSVVRAWETRLVVGPGLLSGAFKKSNRIFVY